MSRLSDLNGRNVLITGASSGIGHAMALACAEAGAAVAVAARRAERLRELVDAIHARGGRAVAVEMDVTREESVSAAFDAAQQALGPVDSVLANAGINASGRSIDMPLADFDAVMDVNTRGMFITAREAARRMIAANVAPDRRGRIVLVASIGGFRVQPGITPYCTSKAATVMLGQALAREWIRSGINVNVLCPGYMETELNAEWFRSEGGRRLIDGWPLKKLMDMGDLAPMVTLLLSDGARAMSGSVIAIDEGQSL